MTHPIAPACGAYSSRGAILLGRDRQLSAASCWTLPPCTQPLSDVFASRETHSASVDLATLSCAAPALLGAVSPTTAAEAGIPSSASVAGFLADSSSHLTTFAVAALSCTHALLRELSEPWGDGERVKNVIERTAKLARLSFWRTSDLWYLKARKVEDAELLQIREALRIKSEKAARNELRDLKFRIAKLEARLSASSDPDFYRNDIDFARDLVRAAGGVGSSVAGKR